MDNRTLVRVGANDPVLLTMEQKCLLEMSLRGPLV